MKMLAGVTQYRSTAFVAKLSRFTTNLERLPPGETDPCAKADEQQLNDLPIELHSGEHKEGVGDQRAREDCAIVLGRQALDPEHLEDCIRVRAIQSHPHTRDQTPIQGMLRIRKLFPRQNK